MLDNTCLNTSEIETLKPSSQVVLSRLVAMVEIVLVHRRTTHHFTQSHCVYDIAFHKTSVSQAVSISVAIPMLLSNQISVGVCDIKEQKSTLRSSERGLLDQLLINLGGAPIGLDPQSCTSAMRKHWVRGTVLDKLVIVAFVCQ